MSFPSLSMPGRFPAGPRQVGFPLVELLVVIAFIGILIGLLLPTVQAALYRHFTRSGHSLVR